MTKWLITGLVGSFCFALLVIALMGIEPRAIKIINPSQFENLQHMGFSIYQRLNQDTNQSKVVIFGSSPFIKNYQSVWEGFLLAQKKYKHEPTILIEFNGLETLKKFSSFKKVFKVDTVEQAFELVNQEINNGKVLVHTTSNISTYLNKRSLSEKLLEQKILTVSFSQARFAVSKEVMNEWQPPCDENQIFTLLTCKAIEASKKYFRKKLSPNELIGVVEKHGSFDYLAFISQPNL
ncbi:MAG: hypothetical protein KDD58_09645 [Bdellovibrionales bacterium]|nr:hypothetical protein [Bdellovibrionales bacterium]